MRAKLLARRGSLEPAEELARAAVAIEARAAAQEALVLYERKGNTVSAAHELLAEITAGAAS